MKTIKKWLIQLKNLVVELINYYIVEPACDYHTRRLRWILPIIALCALAYLASFIFMRQWWINRLVVSVAPWTYVRTAEAAEMKWPNIGDCEQYRPIVQKYFGKLTDEALFVASHESGCIADRISDKNKNGTRDFCLFQINQEKLTVQSLDVCVRRAFEKYMAGRVGEKNWSDFYAVCLRNKLPDGTEGTPIPKYPKVISNCS